MSGDREDTFFEGLHIPPVKLLSSGKENKEAFALLRGNSRAPALVIGDLEGQIGVCSLGSDRIRQLFDRFGIDLTLFAFDHYRRETQRRIEQRLQELNDFEGTAERFIDHDGIDLETPKGIRVRVTKTGKSITFDFSDSDPQGTGPVNVRPHLVKAACPT